jgi:phytoene dehydrogenase-like protein
MKTIIIGSGMSGLTAGAYLAMVGHEVTIYEQFKEPGGVTASTKSNGYGWDNGPLILEGFGPGDKGTIILEELGVAGRVNTVHEDRGLAFPDFSMWKPADYGGPYWRKQRLSQLFPDESQNLEHYYQFYDQMIALMSLARQAETAGGLSALLLKARMALAFSRVKDKVDWNARQLMDSYFQHEELKAFFTGIVADYVTKPSEFPALGVPSIHLETAFDKRIPIYPGTRSAQFGYFYIIGGCQALVDAVLSALTAKGGRVVTNSLVQKIVVEQNRVKGIELASGKFEVADLVIASGGARETFYGLVGREKLPEELCASLDKIRFMESALMVHLGIDFDPRPYQPAALCYYYGTYDLEESIERIRAGIYHEGKEGLLIYVPSLHSPQLAPPGRYAVTIYTIAPDRLSEGSWAERGEELADKLVAEAEHFVPGLRQHTLVREILTPDDFRAKVRQDHHSFGGIPPVIGNKPPDHKTPVEGLWFIGAQSESGGGVMNVMVGAQKTAKRILAEAHSGVVTR